MEGIVRYAREINPKLDTILMYFADPDMVAEYRKGKTPEVIAAHERVAEQYGVPPLNLAREVMERIEAAEFSWDENFKSLHPSPFGQALYFRAIKRMLEAAWKEPSAPGVVPVKHAMPPALDPKSYFVGDLWTFEEPSWGRVGRSIPIGARRMAQGRGRALCMCRC